MRRTHRAITLVEILVVISIIGVLAGLTATVATRVKERARMTGCASNLSQIGKALHLYLGSNDDYYPPYLTYHMVRNGVIYPAEARQWRSALEAFGAKGGVWKCPADPGLGGPAGARPAFHSEVSGISSYETSSFLHLYCDWWADGRMRLSGSQESTAYMMDLAFMREDSGADYTVHGSWGNNLYGDGHVKAGEHTVKR